MPKYIHKKKYELYLDESGVVGSSTGVFTLAGIIVEKRYRERTLDPQLKAFKNSCFNDPNIGLHFKDILQRRNDFKSDRIGSQQITKFYTDVCGFIQSIDMLVVSTTVDKGRLDYLFKSPKDECSVAFNHIMKSVYHFIDDDNIESLDIYFEGREDSQDFKVQKSFFESFYSGGTHSNVKDEIRNKIKRFSFKSKSENLSGLQIIDLICLPIKKIRTKGYLTSGKRKDVVMNDIFDSIIDKMYIPEGNDDVKNWSLKKVPIIKDPGIWTMQD